MKNQIQRVDKPWGHELIWAKTKDYVGKLIHVNAGHKLSLQYHELKEETMYVQSGKVILVCENDQGVLEEIPLGPGESFHILPRKKHRLVGVENADVFEVSTPHLNDVVRLEDTYGRSGTSAP